MKCQCCHYDDYAENLRQCEKCGVVLCAECYAIHIHCVPGGHACSICPFPGFEKAKEVKP